MAWDIHVSCNLLYAIRGITTHGVAMHVTATQGTHLDKYLTTPHIDKHGITFINTLYSENVKLFFYVL